MAKQGKRVVEHYEKEFGSIRELAERTGKNYRTFHRAVKAGKIQAKKFGASQLIPRAEIERVLANGF
jgi:excisionase family DNA binding protein